MRTTTRLLAGAAMLLLAACGDAPSRRLLGPEGTEPRLNHVARVYVCCDATLYLGYGTRLTATVYDTAGRVIQEPVAWRTFQPAVATVDNTGYVKAVGLGTAEIVAIAGGLSFKVIIKVIPAPVPTSLDVTPDPAVLDVGRTLGMTARVYDQYGNVMTGQTPTWKTDHPSIATVSSAGVLTGVARGTTKVRATLNMLRDSAVVAVQPPLTVSVSGPSLVSSEGEYSWTALPRGGSGVYTYQWEVEWFDLGYTSLEGTGATQSLYITSGMGDFKLRVKVTSGGATVWGAAAACNLIPPTDYLCS